MNKKTITCIIVSLIMLNCTLLISAPTKATTYSNSANTVDYSTILAHKNSNKHKSFNVFGEENYKYLSPEQKKALLELKKCKDKGDTLSDEQQKSLNSIVDCIVKGKLGDKNYQDFKCLMDKKRLNNNLSDEENKRLKNYNDILDGTKHTTQEIIRQFLR